MRREDNRQQAAVAAEAKQSFSLEAEVKRREDKFSFYTWVILTFGEGICGKSPFIKCRSFSQMCVPQTSNFFLIKARI